jgi:Xaa-Pro aminopeptidase
MKHGLHMAAGIDAGEDEAAGEVPLRLARARRQMQRRRVDALFVTHAPNIRYLCGFSGSNGLLIVKARSVLFFTDPRYAEQAEAEVRGARVGVVAAGTLAQGAHKARALHGAAAIGFDGERVPVTQLNAWKALLRGVRFRDCSGMIDALRTVKTPEEIAGIRRAVDATDRVFSALLGLIRIGVRERDLAAEITYRHRLEGADRDSFEPIVVSGPRSALIHGQPSERRFRTGDALLLDFGCVVDGWCSDLSRTVFIGRAPRALREAHGAVLRAQQRAIAGAHPGMTGRELDGIARESLTRDGYGDYFPHAVGHGLGLEVHERPRISWASADVLAEGMVTTVEPGVYIPGTGGVRIEDDIVLRAGGAEVLNRAPRELLVL